jgi:hypothetical protein
MVFPVSGVEIPIWAPPLISMVISFFCSMGGVSGAFLLLPFQMSVLGFTGPAVTPTNLLFNVVGIPGGVYRYIREGRMAWPIAWNTMLGTLPGVFAGMIIRLVYLPDPDDFKLFVAAVLIYIGARLILQSFMSAAKQDDAAKRAEQKMMDARNKEPQSPAIRTISWSLTETVYEFYGERFSFSTWGLFSLSLLVGLVGGVYGIGGGAIIAPFIVSVMGLPVHTIAGAALLGTFVTSIFGVIFYVVLAPIYGPPGVSASPDWLLGLLFGLGGLLGMYLGAAAQGKAPSRIIKPILGLLITGLGIKYLAGFFI